MDTEKMATLKGNVKDCMDIVNKILDQFDSDYDIDEDVSNKIYGDIQQLVNDLILAYGCQEIDKKI